MNVSSQQTFTLNQLLAAMRQEAETGVAIVDTGFVELKSRVAEWLQ